MSPNFQSLCLTHVFFKTQLCWNCTGNLIHVYSFFQSYKSSTINGMFLNYYFQWYVGPIYIYIYIYIYLYVLNKIGESTHPCLDPDPRGKVFSFSPLSMMVVMDLHIWPYYVEVHFFCTKLAEVFFLNHETVWNFVKCLFFNLLRWPYDFYPSFYYYITFIDLHMLNHLCI